MSPDPRDPNYNATRKTCPICWEAFIATGRQAKTRLYCSRQCKRTAAARREIDRAGHPHTSFGPPPAAAPPSAPAPLPQPAAQRDCPHCGGPVTIVALLTTPEAARPQMPLAAPDGVIPLHR
ncbi:MULTISPECIES: hypothetical protein [Amycolatopsis]|uniref:Uncharacterized protein n=2 Tax=Amycolatopsis TaxID=1813 RepID=A0A558A7P6_9PSEU|nr:MULTISPECIES: hypothetical protein [Amycolatopsis]PKV92508.1 hypothetical protein ATK30_3314 [Amycolatopsis niigatensis]TVT20289.1 hypothetical protein FNH06_21040 [Amycolatopsis acidiphila]UIJ59697.1 hypothetical protein LWP59_37715 [Amycolatopsis acidiphila]GHG81419.1 hypothetical protein GCM10017788_51300 [Amycolatopsis acidiphila]